MSAFKGKFSSESTEKRVGEHDDIDVAAYTKIGGSAGGMINDDIQILTAK